MLTFYVSLYPYAYDYQPDQFEAKYMTARHVYVAVLTVLQRQRGQEKVNMVLYVVDLHAFH
ncbi:hypothetical protein KIN20_007249 [Parelaphostrongylus tenuis]|uniref:Uncharacterized protein n=1 Tax=Parelaphostrongylus tenuis TaxID=148309 RepID=A0AAD5MV96_PARTN|nr:hypothetical protein KIN20_007249 [Parelaphostrongylus tenuis]